LQALQVHYSSGLTHQQLSTVAAQSNRLNKRTPALEKSS
jgi:hypothetical protein